MNLGLPDLTLGQVVIRVGACLVVLAVYGSVAVWAFRRFGDPGPAQDGRLTLSPFAHLDVFGLVAAIFFRATWFRSMNANPREFRRPAVGVVFTVTLTSAALLALAVLALYARPLVLRTFSSSMAFSAAAFLTTTFEVATATVVLNLLPIPPLLGGIWWKMLGEPASELTEATWVRVAGTLLVGVLLLSGLAAPVFEWARTSLRTVAGF